MKKPSKFACLTLSAFLCVTVLFGCGAPQATLFEEGMAYAVSEKGTPLPVYSVTYDVMGGKDVMPIGGFVGPYMSGGSVDGNSMPNFIDEEYFQLMQDAGVNMFVYMPDRYEAAPGAMKQVLEYGEKYGIGTFMNSLPLEVLIGSRLGTELITPSDIDKEWLYDKIMETSSYLNYKSYLGLWVVDEPFPNNQLKNLKLVMDALVDLDVPNVDFYGNICGRWTGLSTFWNTCSPTTFDDYAAEFMEIPFKMLSVTQYPFAELDRGDAGLTKSLFDDLSVFRKLANDYGVPLWRMMNAGAYFGNYDINDFPEGYIPLEGEFLFDGNISLAYGAKSIQYYTMFQFKGDGLTPDGGYDSQRSGFIGVDGNKTRWYYYGQKLCRQIKAVEHVLMNAANVGVIAHGSKAKAMVGSHPGGGLITSDKFRQLTGVSGDDAVIGCFDYLGGTALYVVNYSRSQKSKTTFSFDDGYCYDVTQRGQSVAVVGKNVTLTLAPGEGALIVLR